MRKEGTVSAVILFLLEEDVWMDIQVDTGSNAPQDLSCLRLSGPGLLKLLPLG